MLVNIRQISDKSSISDKYTKMPKVCGPSHHVCLLNFSFQIYSLFTSIIRSSLLGRLSTRIMSVVISHSVTKVFVRWDTDG